MIVSHKHKFVYMPIIRAASSSLQELFTQKFEARVYTAWAESVPMDNATYMKHVLHLPEKLKEYFVFTVVRNPYTWEISKWKTFYANKTSFKEYILHLSQESSQYHLLKQHSDYVPPPGCVKFKINTCIQMERLVEGLQELPFIGERMEVPVLNKSNVGMHLWYQNDLAAMIRKTRAIDFELFNYVYDIPPNLKHHKVL